MATESSKITIGQFTYETYPLDGVTGMTAFHRYLRIRLDGKSVLTSTDADIQYFWDLFLPATSVSGGTFAKGQAPMLDSVISEHAKGRYAELLQLFGWLIEVNFGDFIATLKAVKEVDQRRVETGET